jgi:hypothetical protein
MRTRENRRIFEKTALSVEEYKMLKRAFRGGNTHASRFYSNKILENVHSYDIQSSYPTVMLTDDFPIGKFTKVTLDTQQKLDKYCNEYCVVLDIELFNVEVKQNISIPYIDYSIYTLTELQKPVCSSIILYSCLQLPIIMYILFF